MKIRLARKWQESGERRGLTAKNENPPWRKDITFAQIQIPSLENKHSPGKNSTTSGSNYSNTGHIAFKEGNTIFMEKSYDSLKSNDLLELHMTWIYKTCHLMER